MRRRALAQVFDNFLALQLAVRLKKTQCLNKNMRFVMKTTFSHFSPPLVYTVIK